MAAKLWSSVASAGAVNPPDIGKVLLVGSVVQLGATGGLIAALAADRTVVGPGAGPGTGQPTQAVIRYGVTAVDGGFNPDPEALFVSLAMLCRPGDGQISARLVQVPNLSPVVYVTETTLVEFQAQKTNAKLFTLQIVSGGDADVFDFESNAYYVEVVLTAPGAVTEYPPAVSLIQLSFTPPPPPGGGAGGGGGSVEGGPGHQPE